MDIKPSPSLVSKVILSTTVIPHVGVKPTPGRERARRHATEVPRAVGLAMIDYVDIDI